MAGEPGPRVVLLVTHGRSAAWKRGLLGPVLHTWATGAAVAVINLLPQQCWFDRGMLTTEVRWSPADPAAPTAQMPWRVAGFDVRRSSERAAGRQTAVAVLERGEDWLRRWGRLLSGAGGEVNLPALLVGPGEGPPTDPAGSPPSSTSDTVLPSVEDLVARFRATASPRAFGLAVRLAAAPLTERVIRAVLRAAVGSGTAELTEVLTGDLVEPVRHGRAATSESLILYEFLPGARPLLLAQGYRDRTVETQHLVQRELAADTDAVPGLTRRILDPRNATFPRVTPRTGPYLRVELAVHEALGGPNRLAAATLRQLLGLPIPRQHRRHTFSTDSRAESPMSETMPPMGYDLPEQRQATRTDTEESTMAVTGGLIATGRRTQQAPATENLPPRNVNFTGRREMLQRLHERLQAGTTAVLPEALHGAGGVGKSQLVNEYVYLHQNDFDLIWWIPAERTAQIQSALSELAERMGLPVTSNANTAVPAVLDALGIGRPFSNWLLVFDNAEVPEEVEQFFPKGGPGRIVITSRNAEWNTSGRASTLAVNVFDRQESVDLLRRRDDGLDVGDAGNLAEALGDLPLAIEQAAAYRAETGITAADYLQRLQRKLAELGAVVTSQDQEYPPLVAAAWTLSLDLLAERDPAAMSLLRVCAFFGPEPISQVLLTKPWALSISEELDPLVRNPNRLKRAIRTLDRLSLVRRNHRTNSFQMHRLVQLVLIDQLELPKRNATRHAAHLLLAGNDPDSPDERARWPLYAELYPHIVFSRAHRCSHPSVRSLVLNEAKYLWRWGDHTGARDLAENAHNASIEEGRERDTDSLRMAAWLGFMYWVNGDYAKAAELNIHTYELYESIDDPDDEEFLTLGGALAADHRVAGDFAGALQRTQAVYEAAARAFTDDDPFTLRAAHNLAVSMRLSGLYGQALRLDQQTYPRLVQIYGAEQADTLSTAGGINLDRRELGDYIKAHVDQESVVATARRVLRNEDHPELLHQSYLLASFRRKAGLHLEALDLSTDVFNRFQRRYGPRHPNTVLAQLAASIDQRVIGDLPAARAAGEAAIEGLEALYSEDHPHTAGAQVNLAVTLRLLGAVEEAKAKDTAALRRLVDRLGEQHAVTIAARINLASDHFELGEYDEARKLDEVSYPLCERLLGRSHPTTLACGANLAMDWRETGRSMKASELFETVMDLFRQHLGDLHPATAAASAGARANCDIDPLPL
ncbi:FxSxx-COOH system tetratricopeptide repeat protein [Dactylosporangium sp. CA-092794]|uniref:FxSxx-COOH system tetratricopeptide repeat protein n=1 Tax=Dactylosporangium sp. CA-092794 TaxID=3239929 RepID=UPI003D8E11DF